MYRALMRDDDARREQNAALAKNPAYAPARYERAILLARRLRSRRKELVDEAWRVEFERRRARDGGRIEPGQWTAPVVGPDEELSRLTRQIEEDLAGVDPAALAPEETAFVRGLAARMKGRDADAKSAYEQAVRLSPRLEDAIEALADLEGADLAAAAAWLTLGIRHDRGYVPYLLTRCVLHLHSSANALFFGLPQRPFFDAAIADADAAAALDPDSVQILLLRSDARCRLAGISGAEADDLYQRAEDDATRAIALSPAANEPRIYRAMVRIDRGSTLSESAKDPLASYRGALEDLDAVLARDRRSEAAWRRKGMVLVNLANHAAGTGGDAEPLYRDALAALGQAIELDPSRADNWLHRAAAASNLAATRRARGGDPVAMNRQAVADCGEAIRLCPAWTDPWMRRGTAWLSLALHEGRTGTDPTASYDAAERDFTRATELDRASWRPLMLRGRLRANRAAQVDAVRGDPASHFEGARADLEESLRRHPSEDALLGLGDLMANWGLHDSRKGRDPAGRYRAAIELLDRAIVLNPSRDESWQARGSARYNLGVWEAASRRDPTAWFESALRDVGEALARNDDRVDSWMLRAKIRSDFAVHLEGTEADPRPMLGGAIADLDRVIALQPSRAEAFRARGVARSRLGSWIADRGGDADAVAAAAVDDFARAIAIEPADLGGRMNRGRTNLNSAMLRLRRKGDATPFLRAAVADFDGLLALARNQPEAWLHRGTAYFHLARAARAAGADDRTECRQALDSWSEALRQNPGLKDYLEKGMKECRERLEE
jgi:tetratricopeptide (TPR) repeat protein